MVYLWWFVKDWILTKLGIGVQVLNECRKCGRNWYDDNTATVCFTCMRGRGQGISLYSYKERKFAAWLEKQSGSNQMPRGYATLRAWLGYVYYRVKKNPNRRYKWGTDVKPLLVYVSLLEEREARMAEALKPFADAYYPVYDYLKRQTIDGYGGSNSLHGKTAFSVRRTDGSVINLSVDDFRKAVVARNTGSLDFYG